jgi:hypothetical protein
MVDLSSISVVIITCSTAVIGIISQIQHSRCSEISLCGMVSCVRNVPDHIEPTVELTPNTNSQQGI